MPKKRGRKLVKLRKPKDDMTQEDVNSLAYEIAERIKGAKTVDDRRDLVMIMDASGLSRRDMFKYLGKPFDVTIKQIDHDIAHVRDWHLNKVRETSREDAMAEVSKINAEILRRAFKKGDLSAANNASRLKASMHQLIKEGIDPNASTPISKEDLAAEIVAVLGKLQKRPIA